MILIYNSKIQKQIQVVFKNMEYVSIRLLEKS